MKVIEFVPVETQDLHGIDFAFNQIVNDLDNQATDPEGRMTRCRPRKAFSARTGLTRSIPGSNHALAKKSGN
ncbi:MAG: hypothetical protein KJZ84_02040 [Bryobacteraceae bacterium]|nr:hypothetical protein [Bryobacteraceae bacterium]